MAWRAGRARSIALPGSAAREAWPEHLLDLLARQRAEAKQDWPRRRRRRPLSTRARARTGRRRGSWPADSPSSASTCAAVVGLMRPERLALGAAMGSLAAASSARATGWTGARSAMVSRPALTRSAMAHPAARVSTSDSGPGQKASASVARRVVDDGVASASASPGTCTISGLKRGRSLAANTLATARRVERIGAEPVDRLGRKGDDLGPRDRARPLARWLPSWRPRSAWCGDIFRATFHAPCSTDWPSCGQPCLCLMNRSAQ